MTCFPPGKVVAPATKEGMPEWYMKYMTLLFFPSYLSFPLEGKGCTGQSNDVILYRYPDRQSAASLATSWSSPPCKQVALVLISAVVKAFS